MTRRRKRGPVLAVALAGVVATGLAFAPVAPGRAQTTSTSAEAPPPLECEVVPSRDDLTIRYCRPADQTSRTSSFPLRVEVANTRSTVGRDAAVTSISLEVVPTLADQEVPEPATRTWEGQSRTAAIDWAPTFTTNGPYDLRILARGDALGGQSTSATVPMRLAAPPHAPTGVKVAKVDDGSLLISWSNTDREPDVRYYEVRRAAEGSSAFGLVDTTEAAQSPRVVDDPGVGSWRYRVIAVRRGATDDGPGIASPPAAESVEVERSGSGTGQSSSTGGGTTTGASSATGVASGSTTTTRPAATAGARPGVALGTITTTGGNRTATTARRTERDPGFDDTLPFDVPAGRPDALPDEEPLELRVDDQAAGEDLISDDGGERRRSLGFVAGGLLLFVLGMTGLFLKAEVRRVDELDALDPQVPVPDELAAPVVVGASPELSAAELTENLEPVAPPPTAPAPAMPTRLPDPPAEPVEVVPPPEPVVAPFEPVPTPEPVVAPFEADHAVAAAAVAATAAAGRTRMRIPRRRVASASGDTVVPPSDAVDLTAAGAAPDAVDAADAAGPPSAPAAPVLPRRRSRPAARGPRREELAAMFGTEDGDVDDDERHLAELATALRPASSSPPTERRVRRTVAPIDAPDLDVPDPMTPPAATATAGGSPTTTRTRTTDRARRAPTRLPSRPADDRREGGAAVRPRRRGTGEGDRRLPVG